MPESRIKNKELGIRNSARGQGDFIRIRGARVHNLKSVDVDIPKNKLVVITGLSGSGKSSLAFDTIYAEAERRYVESLSAYARQFIGISDKPDVDSIEGLSPAIAIDQKSVPRNPRSTVGTITEIYDYLRIIFARVGKAHCPSCAKPIGRQTVGQIVDHILKEKKWSEVQVLAPLVRGKKGEHRGILEEVKRAGFIRVRIDGIVHRLEEAIDLPIDKQKKHSIEVVVDRVEIGRGLERSRLADSVETALKIGKGLVIVATVSDKQSVTSDKAKDEIFSEHFACPDCGINLSEIEPRTFSFNSPYGACFACTGLGSTLEVDTKLVFPNPKLTLAEGAIAPWSHASHRVGRQSWYWWMLEDLADRHKFSLNKSVQDLPKAVVDLVLHGEKKNAAEGETTFEGVVPNLKRRWKETDSEWTRAEIEKYMLIQTCPLCQGRRLKPETLAITVAFRNIADISEMTVRESLEFFFDLPKELSANDAKIAGPLAKEILKRLQFLTNVGLHYLTLSRESTTLAGGEAQRIRLATQIGSRLTGVIYVLDEPSIGLHAEDHHRLIETLKELRDLGNTVIVVEHDAETMRQADWIIDLGPGAGKHGGEVIFTGDAKALRRAKTLTADYISGRKEVEIKHAHRSGNGLKLEILGAKEHNLKDIDVKIPLGMFVSVSGPSGSGKSTLINDILAKALLKSLYQAHTIPGRHDAIVGLEHLDKVVVVDQSPIGRTPRSNPATYTGVFGLIRDIFSKTAEARARGYVPGRFSFNVKGGRCEVCEGQGVKKIEMYFLPDVYVDCEECHGKRYSREALEILYNGKNIADVLDLTVEEALRFFEAIPGIKQKLKTLSDVGLSYVKLGQSATTLSGGEAQRIKLAAELSRRDTGKTLYILDEPTTGLHFEDIRKLLTVLHALADKGNTVLVIEHNLDVIRNSDYVIDLGPEGGAAGGEVVAEGTPAEIMEIKNSLTGKWLKKTG
ncbi:MAG: excinuclease ABC subunit UvrA [Candidatus Sungbacteria bacterium]|uniref:UvrABC system protein A n=1 Tax=Candidatus Sungiibacteriota bacterium TaxID=2750080 RepID=A0A9D6LTB8_9BACT|nr:excinuclease ABC subunit UvrA [Candidatus Sungbacteria bacterium]